MSWWCNQVSCRTDAHLSAHFSSAVIETLNTNTNSDPSQSWIIGTSGERLQNGYSAARCNTERWGTVSRAEIKLLSCYFNLCFNVWGSQCDILLIEGSGVWNTNRPVANERHFFSAFLFLSTEQRAHRLIQECRLKRLHHRARSSHTETEHRTFRLGCVKPKVAGTN